MKNLPLLIVLFLLLFSGCQKNVYYFFPPISESSATRSTQAEEFAIIAKNQAAEEAIEMVGFPAQKVESQPSVLLPAMPVTSHTKAWPAAKFFPVKISRPATAKATVQKKQRHQLTSIVSKAFPTVWFIILSILLGLLLIYYMILSSESQGPAVEVGILILMVPVLIPWLIIAAKPVALMLGWAGFWTFLAMLGAIILFFLFVGWLSGVQEKAQSERYLREQEKKKLERDLVP